MCLNNGLLKCDMHIHSTYSGDSTIHIREIVGLWKTRGILPVVCDHNSIMGSVEVYNEIRRNAPDIPLIIADEILSGEGDIIGLFLNEQVPPMLTAAETLDIIAGQGALSIIPHPFSELRSSAISQEVLYSLVGRFDIIEGYNGRMMQAGENRKAGEFASLHHIPLSAGSDAHAPHELGRCFIAMEPFETPAEFLTSLEKASAETLKIIP